MKVQDIVDSLFLETVWILHSKAMAEERLLSVNGKIDSPDLKSLQLTTVEFKRTLLSHW